MIADTRERAVIPVLRALVAEQLSVAQINTGDFVICAPGERVVACFERKTYSDFAASFCDGRYANFEKLNALRAASQCDLYLVVEGPNPFRAPESFVGAIPYRALESAMLKLMVRDKYHIVFTADVEHTAVKLASIMSVYQDIDPGAGGAPGAHSAVDTNADMTVPRGLLGAVVKPDREAVASMWGALPSISRIQGRILAGQFSIVQLLTMDRVPDLCTVTGRALTRPAVAALEQFRRGQHCAAVLAEVHGVSAAVAAQVVGQFGGLLAMCQAGVDRLAVVQIRQKARTVSLGAARAGLIIRLLTLEPPGPAPAGTAPTPAILGGPAVPRGPVVPRDPAGLGDPAVLGNPAAPCTPAGGDPTTKLADALAELVATLPRNEEAPVMDWTIAALFDGFM